MTMNKPTDALAGPLHRVVSLRRLWWRIVYPFAVVAHRCFGTSYVWVNVAMGAWMTPATGFGPMWHWRWYGQSIDKIPASVNLRGIRYRVAVSEGLVVFAASDGVAGRIEFTRDPHDRYGFLWYLAISGPTPAGHCEEAYDWVKAVYGGSHERKRPALRRAAG